MILKFKCNVCGSTDCYKIDTFSDDKKHYGDVAGKVTNKRSIFNYRYSTSGGRVGLRMEISSQTETYICKSCGHVEFYANDLLNKIDHDEKYYKEKVSILLSQIEVAKRNIIKFKEDYSMISAEYDIFMIENEGIDRIQYENRASRFTDRLKAISTEIAYEEQRIINTEKLIKEYSYFLDNVCNVTFR